MSVVTPETAEVAAVYLEAVKSTVSSCRVVSSGEAEEVSLLYFRIPILGGREHVGKMEHRQPVKNEGDAAYGRQLAERAFSRELRWLTEGATEWGEPVTMLDEEGRLVPAGKSCVILDRSRVAAGPRVVLNEDGDFYVDLVKETK